MKKNIAIVGAGYWGKNLIKVFFQLGVLKSICDLDQNILNKRKAEYSGVEAVQDIMNILNDDDIKGVVLATPATSHYALAKKVLESNKDVFIEKPLALKLDDGNELIELSDKNSQILMVDHLFLYHSAFIELKNLIDQGELGEMLYIYSTRLNFGIIRVEENALWSLTPHDISMSIELFGCLPKSVNAGGKCYLNENICDAVTARLEFGDNRMAEIFGSWLYPIKDRKLVAVGSKKMAVFDDTAKDKLIIYSHKIEWSKDGSGQRVPRAIPADGVVINITQSEPLMEAAKHFISCIKTRQKPKTDGSEAIGVLRILDACQKSMNSNGKSIAISG